MNAIFGPYWGVFDAAPEVPVPVGEPCGWCTVPFIPGDQGIVQPYVTADGTATTRSLHSECFTRELCGSVAHQRGRCSCTGVTEVRPATPAECRAEAIAATAEWGRRSRA